MTTSTSPVTPHHLNPNILGMALEDEIHHGLTYPEVGYAYFWKKGW